MDAFITAAGALSEELLPTVGLIALLFLIAALRQIILVMKQARKALERTDATFGLVDQSLTKIQDPLNTASKISHGVDSAYDSGVKAVANAKEYIAQNKDALKEKVKETVEKVKSLKKEEPVHEPSPEDIIGGK